MPGTEIVNQVVTLLQDAFVTANGGDGRLAHVWPDYPRDGEFDAPADYPRAVVWANKHTPEEPKGLGAAQVVSGGPVGALGLRYQEWELHAHVKGLFDDPQASGPGFRQLVDDVEMLFRQYPTLNNLHGTTAASTTPASGVGSFGAREWAVEWSAKVSRENLPPYPTGTGQIQIAYNTFVYLQVRERIKA